MSKFEPFTRFIRSFLFNYFNLIGHQNIIITNVLLLEYIISLVFFDKNQEIRGVPFFPTRSFLLKSKIQFATFIEKFSTINYSQIYRNQYMYITFVYIYK